MCILESVEILVMSVQTPEPVIPKIITILSHLEPWKKYIVFSLQKHDPEFKQKNSKVSPKTEPSFTAHDMATYDLNLVE